MRILSASVQAAPREGGFLHAGYTSAWPQDAPDAALVFCGAGALLLGAALVAVLRKRSRQAQPEPGAKTAPRPAAPP